MVKGLKSEAQICIEFVFLNATEKQYNCTNQKTDDSNVGAQN